MNSRIAGRPDVELVLEELMSLSHKYICRILDFDVSDRGVGLPPVILVRSEYLSTNFADFLTKNPRPLPARRYISWVHQVRD